MPRLKKVIKAGINCVGSAAIVYLLAVSVKNYTDSEVTIALGHHQDCADVKRPAESRDVSLGTSERTCKKWSYDRKQWLLTEFKKTSYGNCLVRPCNLNLHRERVKYLHRASPCTDVEACVTMTIKTKNRFSTVSYFIQSVRKFYPRIRIIIADELEERNTRNGTGILKILGVQENDAYITYIQTQSGVGLGRHLAARIASTKYILVADDDYIFDQRTNIGKLLDIIENTDLDIVGGDTTDSFPFAGAFRVAEVKDTQPKEYHLVFYPNVFYGQLPCYENCFNVDIVKTFFIAHKSAVLSAGSWDTSRLFYEHEDFFMQMRRAGLKTAVCKDVLVNHRSQKNLTETRLAPIRRASHKIWKAHLLKKWNISDYYICHKDTYLAEPMCSPRRRKFFS